MSQYKVVFVRHGESEWTFENLFCGWVDISLTDRGKLQLLQWQYRYTDKRKLIPPFYPPTVMHYTVVGLRLPVDGRNVQQQDLPCEFKSSAVHHQRGAEHGARFVRHHNISWIYGNEYIATLLYLTALPSLHSAIFTAMHTTNSCTLTNCAFSRIEIHLRFTYKTSTCDEQRVCWRGVRLQAEGTIASNLLQLVTNGATGGPRLTAD
jgi:hypothetical protein